VIVNFFVHLFFWLTGKLFTGESRWVVLAEDKSSICLLAITIRSMNGKIERNTFIAFVNQFSHHAAAPNNKKNG